MNNDMTHTSEQAVEPSIPKLDLSTFKIDDDLMRLGGLVGHISDEQIQRDPRLKSILAK